MRPSTWAVTAILVLVGTTALAGGLASSVRAATSLRCPSAGTPPPGSTVSGGLTVDGFCQLSNVTITGGVEVEPTPSSAG